MSDARKLPESTSADAIDINEQRRAMRILDAVRRRLGMTVHDLEARSGVSASSFYAWLGNARSPNLANLVALAGALGFDIIMRRSK